MTAVLGVDIGGTFTDFFLLKEGTVNTLKIPSTPHNPAEAVIEGVKRLGGAAYIAHGTTHATNILIEKKGARIALITTKGFRDLLEIGRQNRPKLYDFFVQKPKPLIPREDRYEIEERIDAHGNVIHPLNPADLEELDVDGYEAVTVCFLFSYINPVHEQRVKNEIDIPVSVSSDVLPEFREYERLSTTVINTYLMPAMSRYLRLLEQSMDAKLRIIQSNGHTLRSENARMVPAKTILSGPAAGVKAAIFLSHLMGAKNVITMDMGGTSCDVSLVENTTPTMTTESVIDGYPIRFPSIAIHTVGAGGGSIAWIDHGLLRVGPESMGADPGPACYSLGGDTPTVTDANLLLGYLPAVLADGTELDAKKSYTAIKNLGEQIDLDPIETALGILRVADANMSSAIRVVSVQRGHDPREFSLFVFGGAGPLHSGRIAEEIGIEKILIPQYSGVLSALGTLVSVPAYDFAQSYITPLKDCSPLKLEEIYDQIERKGASFIETVKKRERFMDLRYEGQSYEITIPIDSLDLREIEKKFHTAHKKLYGYTSECVELVTLRTTISGEAIPLEIQPAAECNLHQYEREVYVDGMRKVPVYLHKTLPPQMRLEGPCIVEGPEATVLIRPNERGIVDAYRNIILTRR
jgi:N-methylhydantoinase A